MRRVMKACILLVCMSLCLCFRIFTLSDGSAGSSSKGHELSEALANILLGKKKKYEKVSIGDLLEEKGLRVHFPDEVWAQTSAVSPSNAIKFWCIINLLCG